MQCPDCDSIKMFSLESEGDGKCADCHGTGFVEFLQMLLDPLTGQQTECEECQGTGRCQTCGGAGVVEEYELSLAA